MTVHPRKYNRTNRSKQAEDNKEQIISLAMDLLKNEGEDFSIRKLASASSCSERHLYRLFGGIGGLAQELNSKMNRTLDLQIDFQNLSLENLTVVAERVFSQFNKNASLVSAYLLSPMGKSSRSHWLKEKTRHMQSAFDGTRDPDKLRKEALVLSSADFWRIVRFEAGMSAKESLAYIRSLAEATVRKYAMGGTQH